MGQPITPVELSVDTTCVYQQIDGFGVNINSKCWDSGKLIPVMELLLDDLGATLFRLDAFGKSNWIDPRNEFDASVLSPETHDRVYQGSEFRNAVGLSKYLNSRGIDPYITLSGIVPGWMCGPDGKTLSDYDSFAEMCVSYLVRLRQQGVRFRLFGPLNETDLGPVEGPKVSPAEYVRVLEKLADRFDGCGLGDVKFVAAEQAAFNLDYIRAITASRRLRGRLGAFGMHNYSSADGAALVEYVRNSDFADVPVWMTEYGDLDQTGEREWHFSRLIFERLMRLLQNGMRAAMNWDAFDNYHDHDEAWTIYGLIRTGLRCYTPKKRYYACKQMYRFVKPGAVRVGVTSSRNGVSALAFRNPNNTSAVVGTNGTEEAIILRIVVPEATNDQTGLSATASATAYLTTEAQNCMMVPCESCRPANACPQGYQVVVPPKAIFTVVI